MAITFFAEGVKLPAIKKRETGDWIKKCSRNIWQKMR